jgi:hypothetical protein
VSVFAYDNGSFVVHNFRDEAAEVSVVLREGGAAIVDLASGERLPAAPRAAQGRAPAAAGPVGAAASAVRMALPAHGWRAFSVAK